MKKTVLFFLLTVVLPFPLNARIGLSLDSGLNFFSDGAGFTFLAGCDFGADSGLFAGIQAGLIGSGLSNFTLLGAVLDARSGYRIPLVSDLALVPEAVIGCGYAWFRSDTIGAERFFLTVMPALQIDYRPGGQFGISLVTGYRLLFLDIFQGGTIHLGLQFSWRFPEPPFAPPPSTASKTNAPARKPLPRYSPEDARKLPIRTIIDTARLALEQDEMEYARMLTREGLVREPDNQELLKLFSELIKNE